MLNILEISEIYQQMIAINGRQAADDFLAAAQINILLSEHISKCFNDAGDAVNNNGKNRKYYFSATHTNLSVADARLTEVLRQLYNDPESNAVRAIAAAALNCQDKITQ